MATDFIFDGSEDAEVTFLLAHGAGAPMDSASMNAAAQALAAAGFRVARFEFAYMASRRTAAGRKPPPRGSQAGLTVARPPSAKCFIQVASGAENT